MAFNADIVITGIGVVSSLGTGKTAFWDGIKSGQSGAQPYERLQDTPMPVQFAAAIKDFEPKKLVTPRKSLKVMCREIQTGVASATLAMEDASLGKGDVDPYRAGCVYGSMLLYCEPEELQDAYGACMVDGEFDKDLWGKKFPTKLFPLWMLRFLPNMAACHIGIAQDFRGPNNSICQREVSGLLAMIEAATVMDRDQADVMLCGGVGTRLNTGPMVYRGDVMLSHRKDVPAAASRPFDKNRDGMLMGEGATSFVLETREHAERRGAKIYASLAGYARRFVNPQKYRAVDGSYAPALSACLESAGWKPSDVDHVNADGLATIQEDKVEAADIRAVFGDVPVTAPKCFFGNSCSGSGSMETAVSVLALESGELPPNINYDTPDPDCPVNVIHGEPHKIGKTGAVVLSRSLTGQVAAIAFKAES
jgi:3-oxoacyl-[acyl-carrier-protein] synthase II